VPADAKVVEAMLDIAGAGNERPFDCGSK